MARKGALSPKTVFPGTGDMFEDEENGVCWECVRSHTFIEEKERTRYALLKGYSGDAVLWLSVHDYDREWLKSISAIVRTGSPASKRYLWVAATETWQET